MTLDLSTTTLISASLILLILFLACLTRATFGFGDALIAMPLLVLLVPLSVAAPLVALLSCVIGIVILTTNWRDVQLRDAWLLILASAIGVPVGLWLLNNIPNDVGKQALGAMIVAFSIYKLAKPHSYTIENNRLAPAFGVVAGVLAGIYNAPGPAVVVYGNLRSWSPATFRATLQGYFLFTSAMVLAGHALGGSWSMTVFYLFLLSLPLLLLAVVLGGILNRRMKPDVFERFIYIGLIILGTLLLLGL